MSTENLDIGVEESGLFPPVHLKKNDDRAALLKKETEARQTAQTNCLWLLFINSYSAFYIFIFHLISLESLVGLGLSVGLTIFTFNTVATNEASSYNGSIMSWTLLSFAVITPIGAAVRMAFTRRETALGLTSSIRSTFLELYLAHTVWDWAKPDNLQDSGRRRKHNVDGDYWRAHSDATLTQIFGICDELLRLLTLPTSTRSRHKTTGSGRKEACRTHAVAVHLEQSIILRFAKLADLCEIVKCEGLPPNEATRIRQWERILLESIQKLRVLKMYRTPQGLRSFARLFSVLLPPLYAPYYAQMAKDLDSLGMAIVFSIITSLALTSLFETVSQLEDPFVETSILDGVDVTRELLGDFQPHVLALRKHYYPAASSFVLTDE